MKATTPTTFCPSCGFTADINARFCPNCATPLVVPGADPLLTRVRHAVAQDFEVLREIGRGGMAAVFLARELSPRRMVALKVMLPELAYSESMPQRFLAEVQTAAMLEHPNIVTIFRTGEDGGIRYFAMRYIDGASLEQLLLGGGRLPVRLACYVLTEMARALDFAHGEGVVHRDVKPGNVMLDRRWGRAIVTDFGIAKVADGVQLTRTGLTIGTPSYMSPELCRGLAPSSASDQYALGVVAYQLLTGTPTFVGTALDIQNAHIRDTPRPLSALCPECPPALEAAIMRMLEKRPEDRWPRLADALPALLEHVGPEAACQDELRARLLRLTHEGNGPGHERRFQDRRSSDGTGLPPALLATPEWVGALAPSHDAETPAEALGTSGPAWGAPADEEYGLEITPREAMVTTGTPVQFAVTVVDRSGRVVTDVPVSWAVDDAQTAVVSQSGAGLALAPGTTRVTARVGRVQASARLTIEPTRVAGVDVLPRLVHLAPGQAATVRALALSADGYVIDGQRFEWSVSDSEIAAVDQHGSVRALAPGLASVRVSCGGVTGTAEISVVASASAGLVGENGSRPDVPGRAASLDLTAMQLPPAVPRTAAPLAGPPAPSAAPAREASTPGPTPARMPRPSTVDEALADRATPGAPIAPLVAAVRVGASASAVRCGAQLELTAVPQDRRGAPCTDRTVVWRAVPDDAVELWADGSTGAVLVALRDGTVTVTAACDGIEGHVALAVLPATPHVLRTAPAALDLVAGAAATLQVEATDARGRPCAPGSVQWSSSSPAVATVNDAALVTAVAPGAAVIRARAVDGVVAEASVHVSAAPVARLEVEMPRDVLRVGRRLRLNVRPLDRDGCELTGRRVHWSTTTPTLVSVAADGLLAALAPGVAELAAECDGVPTSVTLNVVQAPARPRWLLPAAGGSAAIVVATLLIFVVGGRPHATPGTPRVDREARGAVVDSGTGSATIIRDTLAGESAPFAGADSGEDSAVALGDGTRASGPVRVSTAVLLPKSAPRRGVLYAGDSATLTLVIDSAGRPPRRLSGAAVRWQSSDPSVLAFRGGVAWAQRPGKANITALGSVAVRSREITVEARPAVQVTGAVVADAPKVEHPGVGDAEALADGFAERLEGGTYEEVLPSAPNAAAANAQLRQQLLGWLQHGDRPGVARTGPVYLDAGNNVLVFRLTMRRTKQTGGVFSRKADDVRHVELRAPVERAGGWRIRGVVVTYVG